jgi:hypothetical protein
MIVYLHKQHVHSTPSCSHRVHPFIYVVLIVTMPGQTHKTSPIHLFWSFNPPLDPTNRIAYVDLVFVFSWYLD